MAWHRKQLEAAAQNPFGLLLDESWTKLTGFEMSMNLKCLLVITWNV